MCFFFLPIRRATPAGIVQVVRPSDLIGSPLRDLFQYLGMLINSLLALFLAPRDPVFFVAFESGFRISPREWAKVTFLLKKTNVNPGGN